MAVLSSHHLSKSRHNVNELYYTVILNQNGGKVRWAIPKELYAYKRQHYSIFVRVRHTTGKPNVNGWWELAYLY